MEEHENERVANPNGTVIIETPAEMSRKRKRRPDEWKRNVAKKDRHRPKGFSSMPTCVHGQNSIFKCKELSMQDARKIHQHYYKDANLQSKKNFIHQHVTVSSVQRNRAQRGGCNPHERMVSTNFILPKQRGGVKRNIKVCRAAFLSILQESRDRVQLLSKKYLEEGVTPRENRGGARQVEKYSLKRQAVKDFIKTFIHIQNHYCSWKIRTRQYLNSDLSRRKMWEMYHEKHLEEQLKVEYAFFRKIFNDNFNISFNAPYTDKCSACTCLENKIADEKNREKKQELEVELKVHKKRADTFYEKLREGSDHETVLSYDCQKNLVLPKIPDQEAYYRRQLYLYNFTICEGISTTNQNKENTYCYVWTENQFPKGSVQIASALNYRLSGLDLDGITTVRLFSDGCGGQNKNKTVIYMLLHWLLLEAPPQVKEVVICFPIVGHYFIPPDRVFGNFERQFKAKSVIVNPEEYLQVFEKFSTVLHLSTNCKVSNWKHASDEVLKKPAQWHFQFQ